MGCRSWRGFCPQTLRESESASLGIMDLLGSTRTDTVRGWPGAWKPKQKRPQAGAGALICPVTIHSFLCWYPTDLFTNPSTYPPIHQPARPLTHPPNYLSIHPEQRPREWGDTRIPAEVLLAGLGKVPSLLHDSLSHFYKKELAC